MSKELQYHINNYYGHIDGLINDRLQGWVVDRTDPARVFDIQVLVDGLPCGLVCNNQPREDLKELGVSEGLGGFQSNLPIDFFKQAKHVVALCMPNGEMLKKEINIPLSINKDVEYLEGKNSLGIRCCIDSIEDGQLRGWAADLDVPERIFDIELMIDGYPFRIIRNDKPRADLKKKRLSSGLGGIKVDIPVKFLGDGEHIIALRMPDGKIYEKCVVGTSLTEYNCYQNENLYTTSLSVIVPVYNATEDLEICIERLVQFTPRDVDIIFIDDASTDSNVSDLLNRAKKYKNIRVFSNKNNIGFTKTVNRGFVESGDADVIILNSDARVTPRWTEGLKMAAYSGPRIATATAMSDRAGAFSAPVEGNENILPDGVNEISFAIAFRRNSLGLYPTVPTGNGFCMYIRRDCLNEVGPLDAEAFPRGYGEENDFCMRAWRAGWKHVIDDRTYVFHERSKSFGAAKTSLMEAGRAVIDERYPEYNTAIGCFSRNDKIAMARYGAHKALQACLSGAANKTRILFVISTRTGGTPQTNRDLMMALDGELEAWILHCDSHQLELCRLENGVDILVCSHRLTEPVDPLTHQSFEYDSVVSKWILAFDFDLVHIRHLAWHGLSLPKIVKRLNRKVIFSFHDFYMLSPTIKMLDDQDDFLGSYFTSEGRERRQRLWPQHSQPDPCGEWLRLWRQRSTEALLNCDAFVTTSESARSLIQNYLPNLPTEKFKVIPHGRDFSNFYRLRAPFIQHNERIRILVPGNIDISKGLNILYNLAEYDQGGILEFHILGNVASKGREAHPRIKLHGPYKRDEFADKVAPIRPHIGAVFSIWDETYCHTLTEMWAVGVPVVVFDMPTVASRVRNSGAGWVLDHKDIPSLYENIVRLASDPSEQKRTDAAIADWQSGSGAANTSRIMAASYLEIYRDVLRKLAHMTGSATPVRIAVVCPSARSLREAYASTYIRIWERTRNHIDRNVTYIRMNPDSLLAAVREGTIDAAIITRTAIPQTLVSALLKAFFDTKTPYLLDLDDNLLAVPPSKDPEGIYAAYAPYLRDLLAQAAMVTVSTEPLRTALQPFASRIELLPNRLSDRLWRSPPLPRVPDTHVRALYMGTTTHDEDLDLILPALDAVANMHPHFRMTLIGVTKNEALLEGREHWLERLDIPADVKSYDAFVPWLRQQASRFDFGLAPLTDAEFNATKSCLKLLDYAALGLRVVASDHLVYRTVNIISPFGSLVINQAKQWEKELAREVFLGIRTEEQTFQQKQWGQLFILNDNDLCEFDNMFMKLINDASSG